MDRITVTGREKQLGLSIDFETFDNDIPGRQSIYGRWHPVLSLQQGTWASAVRRLQLPEFAQVIYRQTHLVRQDTLGHNTNIHDSFCVRVDQAMMQRYSGESRKKIMCKDCCSSTSVGTLLTTNAVGRSCSHALLYTMAYSSVTSRFPSSKSRVFFSHCYHIDIHSLTKDVHNHPHH